jgi:hypothetical protein
MKHSRAWKGIVVRIGACVALSLPAGCGKNEVAPAPEKSLPVITPEKSEPEKKADPLAEARERSRANLKEIATAFRKSAEMNDFLPIGLVDPKTGQMGLSWRVQILPYLDDPKAREVSKKLRLNESWDSEHNKQFLASMPKAFAPVRGQAPEGHTFYQGFARHAVSQKFGDEVKKLHPKDKFGDLDWPGIFPDPRAFFPVMEEVKAELGLPVKNRLRLGTIPDGTFHTILAVEAGNPVPWTKPADVPFAMTLGDFQEWRPKNEPKLGGMFDGNFHFVTISGHVHYLKHDAPRDKLWPFIGPRNALERDYAGLGLEEPK